MKIIKIDNESHKNLLIFLERVQVKGTTEAIAFLEIVKAVKKAEEWDEGVSK
jgi:hypothetical protein